MNKREIPSRKKSSSMNPHSVMALILAIASLVLTPVIIPIITLSPLAIGFGLYGLRRCFVLNENKIYSAAFLLVAIGVQIFQIDAIVSTKSWH